MKPLQAEIAWMKDAGLRGWDLAVWGLIVLGVIFLWRIMPRLIKKESRETVASTSREALDGLIAEKQMFIDENNTMIRAIGARLDSIETALAGARGEREEARKEAAWFNNASVERFEAMSGQIDAIKSRTREAAQNSLMGIIYNRNIPPLVRMESFKAYLKGGGNGNCLNFACADLILPNKELWDSLFVKKEDLEDAADRRAYLESLERIRKRVLV